MATFDDAKEVLAELNAIARESDCGIVDTPERRIEARSRIKTRREELAAKKAAADRSMYSYWGEK